MLLILVMNSFIILYGFTIISILV